MKLKSFFKFKQDVEAKYGWNAGIGFWITYVYEQYKRGLKSYEAAVETFKTFRGYTGL